MASKQRFVTYPAVLDDTENPSGVYDVFFPDVPEAITHGNNKTEACQRAGEVLGVILLDYPSLPPSTTLTTVQRQFPSALVVMITTNLIKAQQETQAVNPKQ